MLCARSSSIQHAIITAVSVRNVGHPKSPDRFRQLRGQLVQSSTGRCAGLRTFAGSRLEYAQRADTGAPLSVGLLLLPLPPPLLAATPARARCPKLSALPLHLPPGSATTAHLTRRGSECQCAMPCTCNQCVAGILSPRMLLRLERTAASSAEMVQDSMPAFQGELHRRRCKGHGSGVVTLAVTLPETPGLAPATPTGPASLLLHCSPPRTMVTVPALPGTLATACTV